jgi:RNA-directed DNA polymerase
VSKYAKAYVREKSIKKNAWFHVNRKHILTIDIQEFFGSLKYQKVYIFFHHLGYSKSVSSMLSNLCTLYQSLPQGAPTSPALSNMLMINVDKRISGFVIRKKIRYTRYADDMTFSGDFKPGMVIKFVRQVLNDEGLKINDKKTRVRGKNQRQEVTGIVVNEKMQAPKNLRKRLRQAVYYIEKYGLPSHLEKTNNQRANHIRHLLGIANFILDINPNVYVSVNGVNSPCAHEGCHVFINVQVPM